MKRIYIPIIAALAFIFLAGNGWAQINEGGIPVGFDAALGGINIPVAEMPAIDLAKLQKEDSINDQFKEVPWRFGFNNRVNLNPNNTGVWTTLANGDRLWQLGIHCPDAMTINLAFDEFHIPHGAKMFVYNKDHSHVIGAFTDKTNQIDHQLGCDLVKGSSIVVEYYEPANVDFHGTLNIFRITHGYRSVFKYLMKNFGNSGACENNVVCDPNWSNQKRAVACIAVGGSGICSGSLINDVPCDGTPYFLTANHCGSSGFGSWVFWFNWDSPTCATNTNTTFNSISGATQKAVNGHSDFNLLQLSSTPPANYNVYYEGWSNIWTYADSATGIHHPSGDVKKISYAMAPTHDGKMQDEGNGPADVWRIGQWTDGVTEGGSSGSPLYDQNHRVIGQLYGGPSSCNVSTIDWYDVYGKFATSWAYGSTAGTRLKDWLDPTATGAVVCDGYDPNVAPFSLDAGILNINSPVQTNYCNPGITPLIVLKNSGSTTLTSVQINYVLDNAAPVTFVWNGTLALHAMTTVTLPAFTANNGTHLLKVYTSSPNGSNDLNNTNDTASVVFVTQINTFPILEGFEHAVFPYQTWRIGNPDGNDTWYRNNTLGGFGNSTACAEYDNNTNNNYSGQYDSIYSPTIDFTHAIAPIELSFSVAYKQKNTTAHDSLNIAVSIDCGTTWSTIYAKGGSTLATVTGTQSSPFIPTSNQWRKDSIMLNSLTGHSGVMFAFVNYNANGNNIFLDDININAQSTVGITTLNNKQNAFNIFPNPTNGMLNLSISLSQNSNVEVQLMDLLGNIIATKSIEKTTGGNYTMDLSILTQGMYFVKMQTNHETIVKRITLQK